MPRDERVDAYLDKQPAFARPILERLRDAVHEAIPEIEEAIKWSRPAFLYKGRMLAGMAAFKQHASFGFWQGDRVVADSVVEARTERGGMGQLGRLASVSDLPPADVLKQLILKAAELSNSGARPVRDRKPKQEIETPADLAEALGANPAAGKTFEQFSPSCRREYLEWITEAKRPETRAKRLAQAVEWMAEGKKRNWKYESC